MNEQFLFLKILSSNFRQLKTVPLEGSRSAPLKVLENRANILKGFDNIIGLPIGIRIISSTYQFVLTKTIRWSLLWVNISANRIKSIASSFFQRKTLTCIASTLEDLVIRKRNRLKCGLWSRNIFALKLHQKTTLT